MTELEADLGGMLLEATPHALPHVRMFRRNVLNVEAKGGWRARSGIKGQADYYVLVRGGRHIEIETKSAGPSRDRRTADAQARWAEFCAAFAIPYLRLEALPGEHPRDTIARWIEEIRALC